MRDPHSASISIAVLSEDFDISFFKSHNHSWMNHCEHKNEVIWLVISFITPLWLGYVVMGRAGNIVINILPQPHRMEVSQFSRRVDCEKVNNIWLPRYGIQRHKRIADGWLNRSFLCLFYDPFIYLISWSQQTPSYSFMRRVIFRLSLEIKYLQYRYTGTVFFSL